MEVGPYVALLTIELDFDWFPGLVRRRRPLPLVNRFLRRPHQYRMSPRYIDGLDQAVGLHPGLGFYTSA
jgi:hypothetical protein